ncbi:MAG: hypothetical protein ABH817_01310 [archaeon]
MLKDNWISAIFGVVFWIIVMVSVFLLVIEKQFWVGPSMIFLGLIVFLSIKLFGQNPYEALSDVIFGIMDNSVLTIFAILGANLFGVLGAVVGGAVGNAASDGFAGIFEGHSSQELSKKKKNNPKTAIRSSLGKMAGCLLGAGIILTIAWTLL